MHNENNVTGSYKKRQW